MQYAPKLPAKQSNSEILSDRNFHTAFGVRTKGNALSVP